MAGNTDGFDKIRPEQIGLIFNLLLSYEYHKKKNNLDKLIDKKKVDNDMRLFLAGDAFKDDTGKIDSDRLFSYVNDKEKIKEFINGYIYMVGPEKENIMDEISKESNFLFSNDINKNTLNKLVQKYSKSKLFIDSGAFTAWTKGKYINVDEYINWINERADFIDLYGQVDFIPGDIKNGATQKQVKEAAQKTWENYLYMRPKMKNPEGLLYTFHVGEPYEYLQRALEWTDENGKYIPYIALGGMVGKPMPVKEQFLDTCFEIIKNSPNPNVKVHAFGMTSFDLLEQYPITSADSTSWIMTGANGNVMTDIGIIPVSDSMSKLPNHYSHLDKVYQDKFNEQIKKYGFTLDELRHSRDNRIMFNAKYMQEKANNLRYKPRQKPYKLF